MQFAISSVKYFAGWADKITGQSIEVSNWRPLFYNKQGFSSSLDRWEKIDIHSSWTHRSRRPDHSMWVSLSLQHTSDSRLIQCYHQGMFLVRFLNNTSKSSTFSISLSQKSLCLHGRLHLLLPQETLSSWRCVLFHSFLVYSFNPTTF